MICMMGIDFSDHGICSYKLSEQQCYCYAYFPFEGPVGQKGEIGTCWHCQKGERGSPGPVGPKGNIGFPGWCSVPSRSGPCPADFGYA